MINQEKYKTAEERNTAFRAWKYSHCYNSNCEHNCKMYEICSKIEGIGNLSKETQLFIKWLELDAEDTIEPLGCPFCDGYVTMRSIAGKYWVECVNGSCGYRSHTEDTSDMAVISHNKVAKLVSNAITTGAWDDKNYFDGLKVD